MSYQKHQSKNLKKNLLNLIRIKENKNQNINLKKTNNILTEEKENEIKEKIKLPPLLKYFNYKISSCVSISQAFKQQQQNQHLSTNTISSLKNCNEAFKIVHEKKTPKLFDNHSINLVQKNCSLKSNSTSTRNPNEENQDKDKNFNNFNNNENEKENIFINIKQFIENKKKNIILNDIKRNNNNIIQSNSQNNNLNNLYQTNNLNINQPNKSLLFVNTEIRKKINNKIGRNKVFNYPFRQSFEKIKNYRSIEDNNENNNIRKKKEDQWIIKIKEKDKTMIYEKNKKFIDRKKIYDLSNNSNDNSSIVVPNVNNDKEFKNIKKLDNLINKIKTMNTPQIINIKKDCFDKDK